MADQFRSALTLTVTAAGAISANRFVKANRQQAAADDHTLGVALSAASSGDRIPVVVLGTAPVEAGGAISQGATVKVDANGRAIAWASSGARVGVALEAAGAAGEIIEVLLIPNAA